MKLNDLCLFGGKSTRVVKVFDLKKYNKLDVISSC